MAPDWDVGRSTRTCAATGREIEENEEHFSALREKDEGFVREDYTLEAWADADASAFFSFWRTRRPAADAPREKRLAVDLDAFYAFFNSLEGATERSRVLFRGVAALVLARKRALRLDGIVRDDDGGERLRLYDRRTERTLEVPAPRATAEEVARIEQELQGLFGGAADASADQPPAPAGA